MITKTRAIVVRKTPYTDNSAVVQLFTEDAGLLSFLVQGIHGKSVGSRNKSSLTGGSSTSSSRSNNPSNVSKSALYQLSNVVELVYNHKPGGMQRIKEISLISGWGLASTPAHDQVRWFVLEVLQLALQQEQPEQELFSVATHLFQRLNSGEKNISNLVISAVVDLTHAMGFSIDLSDESCLNGLDILTGTAAGRTSTPSNTLTAQEIQLLQTILMDSETLIGNPMLRKSLFQKLSLYLSTHGLHGKPLQSLEILKEM
ncbi:MAG: repair protein RecO [Bacteroidota bacterium]|jgi:recombinational DNA repair protein (RecF pathway)